MSRTKSSFVDKRKLKYAIDNPSPTALTLETQLIHGGQTMREKAVSMREPREDCGVEWAAVRRQKRGRCEECEWSGEQQQLLYRLHSQMGNRWSVISRSFSGRTDNSVKNHFFSRLRMSLRHLNKQTHSLNNPPSRSIKPHVLYKIMSICEERFNPSSTLLPQFIQSAVDLKHNILTYLYNQDRQITEQEAGRLYRDLIRFNVEYKVRNLKGKDTEDLEESGEGGEGEEVRGDGHGLSPKSTHLVESELTKLELTSSASPFPSEEKENGVGEGEELIERAPILLQSPFLSIQPLFQLSNYIWEEEIYPGQQCEDESNAYYFCADLPSHWGSQ